MGLFGDEEIKKAIAEAEAMLTVKNMALFKKEFLRGYAELRAVAGSKVMGFPSKLTYPHNLDLSNWSYLIGMLAGYFKWFPRIICSDPHHILASIHSIKCLYNGCGAIGEEKARKIIRTLILAWQKRIKSATVMDPDLNKNYLEFLSSLKGL
ncbi:MAG TPA: hypothetical protein VJA23_06210 [Candidatus Nanoarchaeia archaeon]|nr:hypothetical protein [Candidatus Nanoarchaeia archaeon]